MYIYIVYSDYDGIVYTYRVEYLNIITKMHYLLYKVLVHIHTIYVPIYVSTMLYSKRSANDYCINIKQISSKEAAAAPHANCQCS